MANGQLSSGWNGRLSSPSLRFFSRLTREGVGKTLNQVYTCFRRVLLFHQTRNISGWEVPTVAFDSPVRDPLALLVLGEVLNEFTSNARKKRDWKLQVAEAVKEARGTGPWDPGDDYAISLAFRFHPGFHGVPNRSLDVENFVKPVLDAVAAGLFCAPDILPDAIPRWDYDDSNFSTLFVHRLPATPDSGAGGVAVFVSSGQSLT